MLRAERALLVAQPLLFAAGVVIARFVELPSAPYSLVRPVVVAIVAAALVLAVAWFLTRDWAWAAMSANFVVLLLLRESGLAAVFGAVGLWWWVITIYRRTAHRNPPPGHVPAFVARAGGYFALAYLAVMAFSAYQATNQAPAAVEMQPVSVTGQGGPDIYLIMLDGYPRADTLDNEFDYDNSAFEEELSRLGFDIADAARANYNKTWLTLASMLNGAYIADLLGDQPVPADDPSQIRWLYALINRGQLLDVARDRGYVVSTIPVPITSADISSADEYIDHGYLTELEAKILWSSPLAQIFPDQTAAVLFANQRALIEDSLETTAALAERDEKQPRLHLTEVHSPHPPFALTPSSVGPPSMPECFPTLCSFWQATIQELAISQSEYRERMVLQLEELNSLVLGSVRRIVDADPHAVVVLWSDHGLRYSLLNTDEHFRSFLAARSPDGRELFPSDASPVNILRTICDAYFGTELGPLPYRAWLSDWDYTLRLTPVE